MARPTKWTKELEEQAYDYIRDYEQYGHMIPSIEGLAIVLDLHRDTLYDWAKQESKGFSDILGKLLQMQQQKLIDGGLSNKFNSAITKLVLGKHGFHDKMEQDISSSDGSMKPQIIELVAKVNEEES
jgi:hypothetical protein